MLVQSLDGSVPVDAETYYNTEKTISFTVTNLIDPTINKFSGNMLYVDNKQAFTPSGEQFVVFRTFIKF